VKAFNNIHHPHLRDLPRPAGSADRTALPIAGDDPGAKRHAAELLSLLGYDAVDMGPLSESWRSQVGTPVFCAPYAVTKDDQYRTQPAAPASAAEIRAALASAQPRARALPTRPAPVGRSRGASMKAAQPAGVDRRVSRS
jgi:8-hydroxy-5-deazaflavin:NADPH oxidoreductase